MANRISKTERMLLTSLAARGRITVKLDVTTGRRGGSYMFGQREWNAALKLVSLGFATVERQTEKAIKGGVRRLIVLQATESGKNACHGPGPLSILFDSYDSKDDFVTELLAIPQIKELLNVRRPRARRAAKETN